MKRLFTFLVLCLPLYLFAQGFGSFSHDQPFFAKDTSSSAPVDTNSWLFAQAFRWVASDLSNSPVAAWPDRLQSRYLVQATGANQPTWASNSVIFDATGDQFMTLTNSIHIALSGVGSASNALLVVCSSEQPLSTRFLIDSSTGGQDAFLWHNFAGNIRAGSVTIGPWPAAGKNLEYLHGGFQDGIGNQYTNGVLAVTQVSYSSPWVYLGRHNDGTFKWYGTVKEIIIWTNLVELTSNMVFQTHQYVTNTYGPSTF